MFSYSGGGRCFSGLPAITEIILDISLIIGDNHYMEFVFVNIKTGELVVVPLKMLVKHFLVASCVPKIDDLDVIGVL